MSSAVGRLGCHCLVLQGRKPRSNAHIDIRGVMGSRPCEGFLSAWRAPRAVFAAEDLAESGGLRFDEVV